MSKGTSTNQDRTKVGEGKKPTGLFKRVEDARKQSTYAQSRHVGPALLRRENTIGRLHFYPVPAARPRRINPEHRSP